MTYSPAERARSPRRHRRNPRRLLRFVAFEIAIWALLYGVYLAVRGVAISTPRDAFEHASDVVRFEKAVGLFHEAALQQRLMPVADVFSTYYMLAFGPLIVTVCIWLALRQPELYRELRNALLLSLALATIVFVLFPTAPPRLVSGLQIHDTVGLSGHDTGSFMGIRFNPYAGGAQYARRLVGDHRLVRLPRGAAAVAEGVLRRASRADGACGDGHRNTSSSTRSPGSSSR